MCTCEEIERGTHACRASKLGPVERWWTQDSKLRITIQDPPQSPEDGHFYCIFTYSYYIISRVKKLANSLLVLRHYEHVFLFLMLTLHVTFVTVVFIFAKYLSLYLHIFHMHIQRDIHTSTHVQSAHKRNNDSRAQGPG